MLRSAVRGLLFGLVSSRLVLSPASPLGACLFARCFVRFFVRLSVLFYLFCFVFSAFCRILCVF